MVATVDEWEKALEYCRRFGRNSVSYLTLEPDKNLYFSEKIEGVASYCISGRVMLLCGDPICEENNLRFFLQELIDYAKINRYKLMFLFTLAETVSTYRELGLSPFKIGEEAVIGNVQGWTIAGRKNAKVRSAWHSAENRGLTVKEYSPWICRDLEIERQFNEISEQWLAGKSTAKLQFEVGSLMLDRQCDKRYFYTVDSNGIIQGFNVINPYMSGKGWIIDVMRRRMGCPHGVMEQLFHDIMEIAKKEGIEQLSLGASPFYNTASGENPKFFENAGKFVFEHLNHIYGFKPLQEYKAKFNPEWQELYLVTNTRNVSFSMVNSACSIIDSEGLIDYLRAMFGIHKLKEMLTTGQDKIKSLYHKFMQLNSFLYMLSLDQKSCEEYCRRKRIDRFKENKGGVKRIWLHSLAHRILMPLLWLDQYFAGNRLSIIKNLRTKTKKPVIFCPTHIGGSDAEMSLLTIHDPCWMVVGDPRELYRNFDGALLQINGAIMFDTQYKEDRRAAKAKMIDLLKKGGNLIMYPEGAQDISPNGLLNHLYAGAVELAITCGADIVPIALHRDKNKYYANVGANISYEECDYSERYKLTNELRDRMATLKWEIIESLPSIKRQDVKDTAYDDFLQDIFAMDVSYTWTLDDVRASMFKPADFVDADEVYSFMDRIKPNNNNAFLFGNR